MQANHEKSNSLMIRIIRDSTAAIGRLLRPTEQHQLDEDLLETQRHLGGAINWMHDYLNKPSDGRNDPLIKR
jgi:hypothetical protein